MAANEAGGPRTHVVEIRQFKYFPASLQVRSGDIVVWKNLDAAPHTATSQDWDSGRLNRNQSWRLKVTGNGVIEYICTYHPMMKGKIIIK
ncbi:MAG: cupredoxin domain-containing protein [Erythrobacter sp.]